MNSEIEITKLLLKVFSPNEIILNNGIKSHDITCGDFHFEVKTLYNPVARQTRSGWSEFFHDLIHKNGKAAQINVSFPPYKAAPEIKKIASDIPNGNVKAFSEVIMDTRNFDHLLYNSIRNQLSRVKYGVPIIDIRSYPVGNIKVLIDIVQRALKSKKKNGVFLFHVGWDNKIRRVALCPIKNPLINEQTLFDEVLTSLSPIIDENIHEIKTIFSMKYTGIDEMGIHCSDSDMMIINEKEVFPSSIKQKGLYLIMGASVDPKSKGSLIIEHEGKRVEF